MPKITLRQANPADRPAVEALPKAHPLPLDGAREHLSTFVIAECVREVVGCAGAEPRGDVALLRSVAVAPGLHAHGIGREKASFVIRALRHGDPIALKARAVIDSTVTWNRRDTVRPHGHREPGQPAPGHCTVGVKSCGRTPTFLMATGFQQVRSVVDANAGDLEVADRVALDLPETGLFSLGGSATEGIADGSCRGTTARPAAAPVRARAACC